MNTVELCKNAQLQLNVCQCKKKRAFEKEKMHNKREQQVVV
jgi:hypothetical protein